MPRALGEFEQLILFALVDLGEGAYGAAIGRSIEERTGRQVSAGAVYTALDRLTKRGYVRARVGRPTPERGGRRKKYYRIEPEGAAELHRSIEAIRTMSKGLMPTIEAIVAGHSGE
ncbi:MAG: PadR family transcriptional regulator [Gemmatimonadota bacterium]